jgi:hypothetical protein
MTRLVRYAGFDPHENDFDGELAPLHDVDLIKPARLHHTGINIDRARHLRSLGRTWQEVGRLLAIEAGRKVAYRGASVWWALQYATAREVHHADR